jgi:hypothetical protein
MRYSTPHYRRGVKTAMSGVPRGTTLAEVLMSLMVMGIGVVSLATLFPISAARVLEATNLTNSTVLLYNAEGIVDSFPAMIHEPDGLALDPVTNRRTNESGRHFLVDPLGFRERYLTLDLADDSTVNNSVSNVDPALLLFEYNRPSAVTLPLTVDAAGSILRTRYLGEDPASPSLFSSTDIARAIVSLPDSTTDYGEGFPDPTGTTTAAYVTNADNRITGLVLPVEIDLSALTLSLGAPGYQSPSLYQAVVFDKSGNYSEIRTLTTVTAVGNLYQITWEQDQNGDGDATDPGEDLSLPSRFTDAITSTAAANNVGLVRIEQPVSDYTWMLTVRKRVSGPANVDVVVFRKRDFSELSDQVYSGELRKFTLGVDGAPGQVGVDDNLNGTTDEVSEIGYPKTPPRTYSDDQPNYRLLVDWTPSPGNGYPVAPIKPPLMRGGYIYDPVNGLWYRIKNKQESPVNPATSSIVILEDSIARDNTEDRNGNGTLDPGEDSNGNGAIDRGGVIIPQGVVAVFPLETKVP